VNKNKVLKFKSYKVSCDKCRLSSVCIAAGLNAKELHELDRLIERPAPMHCGKHIYRQSDPFNNLYVIRSGSVKNYTDTRNGTEHVLGFTLPGEMLTLEVMASGSYSSSAIALETTSLCKLPFEVFESLCQRIPRLQKNLFNIAAKEIAAVRNLQLLMSQRSSEERLAVFLFNLSAHREKFGYSGNSLYLSMARHDIANYLGLACETVSRIFTKFSSDGILEVRKRYIQIKDYSHLLAVANASDLDLIQMRMGKSA
jgi:CRP/FNR family transcriptional regulator